MSLVPGRSQYNVDHGIPCRNPSCKSYGKPHFNCLCTAYGPQTGGSSGPSGPSKSIVSQYSEGGNVRFCDSNQPHRPECEHYAIGGEVMPAEQPEQNDDPHATIGHALVSQGVLGLLRGGIGDGFVKDKEKQSKLIDDAKRQHNFVQMPTPSDGLTEHKPVQTVGSSLGSALHRKDHKEAAGILKDMPLVGDASQKVLEPIIERLHKPLLERETNPEAFRGAVDYLSGAARGSASLEREVSEIFGEHKHPTHSQESSRESAREELKKEIETVRSNPRSLLDVSGSLGHYLPNHATSVAATAAQAVHYLDNLRPKPTQTGPLDEPVKPNPVAVDNYNRQLDLANHPMLVFEHIKSGTLQQQDLTTIRTIFPGLHKSIVEKVGQEIINAKSTGIDVPYKHRMALSLIMSEPLDSTLTSQAMMAIIQSAPGLPEPQQGKSGHVTAQTQKTIDKTTDLYQTESERREASKKD